MSNSLLFVSRRALPFALAASLALLALPPSTAAACSCMQQTPEEAAENASAIFEGQVARIETVEGGFTVHFNVVRTFKGPSHEELEVHTGADSAGCGYAFAQGTSYLVYASESEGALSTSLCSHTMPIADPAADDHLKTLGLGVTPFDPGAGSDQKAPEAAPASAPHKGGCASCTIGGREHEAGGARRSMAALALLVLGAAYRITSRRRSGSRS